MNAPLSAFVLKCPECGAPQPGPEPVCRFCKVPLMWAPTGSLSRDDGHVFGGGEVEDEPGTIPIGIGPFAVEGAAEHVWTHHVKRVMRPTFLWIDPANAPNFFVKSFRIGVIEIFDESLVPGKLFARSRGYPLDVEPIAPGELVTLTIASNVPHASLFAGALRAKVITDRMYREADERRVGGYGPPLRTGGYGPPYGPIGLGGKRRGMVR